MPEGAAEMQPEPGPKDSNQPAQTLAWLEEERRRDRVEVQKLQHMVEQLASRQREATGRLEVLENDLRQVRGQASRLSQAEDALRQVREALAVVQEWQEDHQRAGARTSQSQAAEAERDRRLMAEMQSQVAEMARELEAQKSRLLLLGDEVRRDKGNLAPIQQDVELLAKQLQGMVGRLDLGDEAQRHRDVRVVELGQHVERLSSEQSRFTDWQRLAEVRWTRQLAEWQQQMEEWRRQAEDAAREVAAVMKQLPAMRDEIGELRRLLAEERERGAARAAQDAQWSAQREIDRETLAQVEQAVATIVRRGDELSGVCDNLITRLDRLADQQQALDGRLRAERERVESILLTLARLEARDGALEQRVEQNFLELSAQRREHTGRLEELARSLAEMERRLGFRLAELERLEEEHKQREIAELEQQVREMQERARQAKH